MKNTCIIIVAVAGYCVFEVITLFLYLLPVLVSTHPGLRDTIILGPQLLLIPGLAAVFSLLIYGFHNWRRRVLLILALGSFGIVALFVLVIGLGLIVDQVASGSVIWSYVASLLIGIGLITILLLGIRAARKRGVRLEMARWLTERRLGISSRERKSRSRAIRYSLWIPSITVLLVFLFLPEVWGILSHRQGRDYLLAGYRVPVPPTWIIMAENARPASGYSNVQGLASQGLGFTLTRHLHWWDIPLSQWSIGTEPYGGFGPSNPQGWTPRMGNMIAQRDFLIGSSHLTCVDYWPSGFSEHGYSQDSSIAYVECHSPHRLRASFSGERFQVLVFYRMLEGTRQTN